MALNRKKVLKGLLAGLSAGTILLVVLTVCQVRITGYMIALVLYACVFAAVEITDRISYKKKTKEYHELDLFFSEVRQRFYVHGMADEAVYDTAEMLSDPQMHREAEKILDVLNSNDTRAAAENYRTEKHNKYLKLFLTLCITVLEYGDVKTDGNSLFLGNLMNLKEELRSELESEALLRGKMAGVEFVAVIPAFFLKIIENWATDNLPELEAFYKGTAGITLLTALFTLSIAVYAVLVVLKGRQGSYEQVNMLVRRIATVPGIHLFFYRLEQRLKKYTGYLRRLLYEAGEILNVSEIYIIKFFLAFTVFTSLLLFNVLSLAAGDNAVHLMFIFLLAATAFFIPEMLLYVKRYMNRISMEEEVMQYHSVISMLMCVKRISSYEILEELEQFAVIFRKNISDCLNDFHSGEEKALENMSSREGCTAFKNLAEKFIMCDRIGVMQAFDEIKADRDFYMKKRARETAQSISKRAVLAQFLAFIPLVLSVGLYLIVPFAKQSLEMLTEISAELNL